MRHSLTSIDSATKTADCAVCGQITVYAHGVSRGGYQQWRCSTQVRKHQQGHRRHLKDSCERCGFVPVALIQLDGHHRDRDRSNNTKENIETLCANCHRLEHPYPNREYTQRPLAPTHLTRVA